MGILRLLLVAALIAGGAFLALRTPFFAYVDGTDLRLHLETAPFWSPPETPKLGAFEGMPRDADLPDATIRVVVNRRQLFGALFVTVVGLFFLFGLIGTLIERRPDSMDVSYSLWLSLGMLLGALGSLLIAHLTPDPTDIFPYLPESIAVGFIAGLLINWKGRRRLRGLDS